MTTYAVTAASGQLGSQAVTALIEAGIPAADIVAVVRTPEKATALAALGVQVRAGDYSDAASMTQALAGTDRVLLVSSPTVGERATQHRNAITGAESAGVQRLVYTSLARVDHNTMPLAPEHRETEAMLTESPLETVVLRNGWYLENFTESLDQYRAQGAIIGASNDAKISAATRADYARAAAVVLTADSPSQQVYELGGPAFTMTELAAQISTATGTDLPYRNVTLDEYTAGLRAAGLDEGTAGFVSAMEAGIAAGELEVPVTDLELLLGRPVTPLAEAVARLV